MKKTLAIAGTLVVALGLVGLVGFRHGGHCGARDPEQLAARVTEHVNDVLDDLNATPDQRTRILAVKDRLLADAKKLHGEHATTHQELLAQWNADAPDPAKLHALVDQRAAELKGFADEAVDALVEVHGILTPDQRAKLAKKAERHARW